ncbi:MAG: prepilin peptidase [Acidimicrobiia bacterium]
MQGVLVLVAAAAGLVAGCPLNAVIDQVSRKEPGRLAIRWQLPATPEARLVHLAGAALFAAAAVRFGWSPVLPAWLVLVAGLLAISVIDLEHYIVPNRILVPMTIAALPLLALGVLDDEIDPADLIRAVLAGAAGLTAMLALNLISPRGMGMGDVKMSFVLGLHLGVLGWGQVVLGFFSAFLLGAVVGLTLIALKIRGRKDAVPFGPFLAAGTVLAALWGDPILRWYSGG